MNDRDSLPGEHAGLRNRAHAGLVPCVAQPTQVCLSPCASLSKGACASLHCGTNFVSDELCGPAIVFSHLWIAMKFHKCVILYCPLILWINQFSLNLKRAETARFRLIFGKDSRPLRRSPSPIPETGPRACPTECIHPAEYHIPSGSISLCVL